MIKKIFSLIMFSTCLNLYSQNEKLWTLIKSDSLQVEMSYRVSNDVIYNYFYLFKKDCVNEGWLLCDYTRYAKVEFFKNGNVNIIEVENTCTIPIKTPIVAKWEIKSNKLIFNSILFIDFPSIDFFPWVTQTVK